MLVLSIAILENQILLGTNKNSQTIAYNIITLNDKQWEIIAYFEQYK